MTAPVVESPESKSCFDIDLNAYGSFKEAVANDPSKANFTFKATTEWQGGARARTTARQFTLTTDEPDALGGTDRGLDPVELFLASASTCLQIGIVTQAARRKIDLRELRIDAEGDIDIRGYFGDESVRPGYQQVRYKVHVKADAPREVLEEIVSVAQRTSPMVDSVANGAPLQTEIELETA